MAKFIFIVVISFMSSAYAQECASTVKALKELVGNNSVSMNWKENTNKNPLTLRISNEDGKLLVGLTSPKGQWARVKGVICKKSSDTFIAKVDEIVWGEAAPRLARGKKIKELKLKLPYHTLLKVSVSLFSFEFSPLE